MNKKWIYAGRSLKAGCNNMTRSQRVYYEQRKSSLLNCLRLLLSRKWRM